MSLRSTYLGLALVLALSGGAFSQKTGTETKVEKVEKCCGKGSAGGRRSADESRCLWLQAPDGTNSCKSAFQLACLQAVREKKCDEGVSKARVSGSCSELVNRRSEETECCRACLLGIEVASEGGHCETDTLFGSLVENAYSTCCQDTAVPTTTNSQGSRAPVERNVCLELAGELCAHTCVPTQESYRCTCRSGFRLMSDGKSCTPETRCDGCSHSCEELPGGVLSCSCPPNLQLAADNATCIEKVNENLLDRNSACPEGFQNADNGTNICIDYDECSTGNNECNKKTEKCVNTPGSYTCLPLPTTSPDIRCQRGFRHNPITRKCEDINECYEFVDDPPCDSNQDCRNTAGSFLCTCKLGYRQDPLTFGCVDVNECQQSLHSCAESQRCDNTIGSYVCVRDINCGTGYTLNHHTGKCEDDNECEIGSDTCRFLGSDWECINTKGSFRCVKKSGTVCSGGSGSCSQTSLQDLKQTLCSGEQCSNPKIHCPPGYRNQNNLCIDINECEEGSARCKQSERCININGSYLCSDVLKCQSGFKLNPSKTQCIDINECKEQDDLCSHECDNTYGGFRCLCRLGYRLHSDNRTCVDINECELGVRCQGFCINEEGSYSCGCPPGYKMAANKHFCIDINECDSPQNACQEENNEICINLAGSFRCNVIACPPGYHRDPSRRTRCQRDNLNCLVDDIACKKQPATYTYNFITMVSNYTMPFTGYVKLFTVESKWGSASPDFKLDLLQARVPPGVEASTRSDFNLNKQYGKATIELLKPLFGPQEIQLELKTEFFNNNNFLGVSVFTIEIYVSQYTF